ncbi:MAG: HAD hydrolase-like protein [Planctomycetota bacterium]|nr:HAD hydrolase-like protein [Planctomycetota bacterium]MDA1210984.1 HAD hydrolase-like protein [Planctomycetota bacterium]
MALSTEEYIVWLETERQLIWPQPAPIVPAKATPYLKKLPGIRAVLWNLYGTLLHISEGELLFFHPQPIRIQIALDKTIHEFNMWQSMTRKPGAPWEYLLPKYRELIDAAKMRATNKKGDVPEIDSVQIWEKLISRLEQKEYQYDVSFYGDREELAEKVAYFFHASLQGVDVYPGGLETMQAIIAAGFRQGLLADVQSFSLPQLLRVMGRSGKLHELTEIFTPGCVTLSIARGVRKPSLSLYEACVDQLEELGVRPESILYISNQLTDDLAVAKRVGMRTALFAGDKTCLRARSDDLKNPEMKPDRLFTELPQVLQILGL